MIWIIAQGEGDVMIDGQERSFTLTDTAEVHMIEQSQTVGEIARDIPVSTRVFGRYKIDFCCGGGISLAQACAKREVEPAAIIEEILVEQALASPSVLDGWQAAQLSALVEHILERYHRPLDEELPRLEFLAKKVARVHGERDEALAPIAQIVIALREELEQHFYKEEQILFPMILAGELSRAVGPIQVMLQEHDAAGALLHQLRELTRDYALREDACGSWRALWAGLEGLELSLHEHIHLENNILFPRVLAA